MCLDVFVWVYICVHYYILMLTCDLRPTSDMAEKKLSSHLMLVRSNDRSFGIVKRQVATIFDVSGPRLKGGNVSCSSYWYETKW